MYQPWVAHHYPGVTPANVYDLRWSTYVSMWDLLKGD